MKKTFKLLTIILAMSSFTSCTIEESKRYCAVSRVSTGECLEWRKRD